MSIKQRGNRYVLYRKQKKLKNRCNEREMKLLEKRAPVVIFKFSSYRDTTHHTLHNKILKYQGLDWLNCQIQTSYIFPKYIIYYKIWPWKGKSKLRHSPHAEKSKCKNEKYNEPKIQYITKGICCQRMQMIQNLKTHTHKCYIGALLYCFANFLELHSWCTYWYCFI